MNSRNVQKVLETGPDIMEKKTWMVYGSLHNITKKRLTYNQKHKVGAEAAQDAENARKKGKK